MKKKEQALWSWRSFINRTSPPVLLVYTFVALIAIGTLLLSLPFCWKPGMGVGLLDALFTAASAACVTGLTTISVQQNFNLLGQMIILLLFQFGGLGVMTFAAVSLKLLGSRLSLRSQAALEDSLYQRDAANEFQRTFHYIFYLVFSIELVGAILLTTSLWGKLPFFEALWYGIFHSVSAFCNAGFSLWDASLQGQGGFFLSVIMILIVVGGLGNTVLVELAWFVKSKFARRQKDSFRWFSFHTRVVLIFTTVLLVAGFGAVYWLDLAYRPLSVTDALFETVTARTAGFCTFAQEKLPLPAALFVIWLMFVGGSPGSCAGGIKVTSFGIWVSHLVSGILRRRESTLMGRSIPDDVMTRVRRLINLTVAWNAAGVFFLSLLEPEAPLIKLVFEQVSAFATVGLTMDFTPYLSDPGKVWIILSMFVGRLGPLTIALSVITQKAAAISHPEGRVMIG